MTLKQLTRKYEGELTPQEKMIERLRKGLLHNDVIKIRYKMMCDKYGDKLGSLIDHIEDKTGVFIMYDNATKAKEVFDSVWNSRNHWRLATFILAGLIIGNIIATFLI